MSPQIFNFNNRNVRAILDDSENPWFVAKDVCELIGLTNVSLAVNGNAATGDLGIEEDEKGIRIVDTLGGPQKLLCVNESGVYSLIFKSKKSEAALFRRWVTHEVLPAIRKTGQYAVGSNSPAMPQTYTEALRELLKVVEANESLALEAHKNAPMVEFYHTVASSDDTISMNDTAKLLGLGRNKMMRELRRMGVLMKSNAPFQKFIDAELFRVIESTYEDSKGDSHVTLTTRVYQRGVEYIRRRFNIPPPNGLPEPTK